MFETDLTLYVVIHKFIIQSVRDKGCLLSFDELNNLCPYKNYELFALVYSDISDMLDFIKA